QRSPARLMRSTNPRAIVAVKVLVKHQVVPPVRISLKLFYPPIQRSAAVTVANKNTYQPVGDIARHIGQRNLPTRCRRTHHEVRAVCLAELSQRFNQKKTRRKPDRTAPI